MTDHWGHITFLTFVFSIMGSGPKGLMTSAFTHMGIGACFPSSTPRGPIPALRPNFQLHLQGSTLCLRTKTASQEAKSWLWSPNLSSEAQILVQKHKSKLKDPYPCLEAQISCLRSKSQLFFPVKDFSNKTLLVTLAIIVEKWQWDEDR